MCTLDLDYREHESFRVSTIVHFSCQSGDLFRSRPLILSLILSHSEARRAPTLRSESGDSYNLHASSLTLVLSLLLAILKISVNWSYLKLQQPSAWRPSSPPTQPSPSSPNPSHQSTSHHSEQLSARRSLEKSASPLNPPRFPLTIPPQSSQTKTPP